MEAKKKSNTVIVFIVVLLLAVFFIIPFFLVILNSFKTSPDFVANPFSLPTKLHTENYETAFNTMNFLNSFKNFHHHLCDRNRRQRCIKLHERLRPYP